MNIQKLKALGLSAILFSLTLAYNTNTAQACCPGETNTTTLPQVGSVTETKGDPIALIDGTVLLEEKDLVLATPGLSLEFIRSWRTPGSNSGTLPGGWEHSFEWKVLSDTEAGIPAGTNVYQGIAGEYKAVKIPVNQHDGSFKGGRYYFVRDNTSLMPFNTSIIYNCVGRELSGAKLYLMTDGTWRLTEIPNRRVIYFFDAEGDLIRISYSRADIGITLKYDNTKKLTNIAHTCGTSLSLSYDTNNYLTAVRNNRDYNLWVEYSTTNYNNNLMFKATRHVSANSNDNLVFKYYYQNVSLSNGLYQPLIFKKETPVGDEYFWQYENDGSLRANASWIVSGGITNNYRTTLTRTVNNQNTQMSVDVVTDQSGSIGYSTNTYMYNLVKMVPTNIVGPLPGQIEYRTYDDQNNLTEQCFALWYDTVTRERIYDTNRNLIALSSSYGQYNSQLDYSLTWTTNRIISSIKDALNRGYQFKYTLNDLLTQVSAVDENNHTRSLAKFSYDAGLLTHYTNANSHVTILSYSILPYGKSVTVQPPLGYSKQIKFDYLWRPLEFIEYDSDGIQRTNYFQTDYAGRPLTITNPSNQVTSFQYDKAGRLIYAEDPSGYYITNQWRLGKLVSQTTGKTGSSVSANISLEYDQQMTMVSVKDPMNRYVETYGLDAAGQITTVTNLEGQTMEITRGVLGMVTDIKRFDDTYVSITYANKGLVSSVSYYNNDNYYYNYFANGLLSSISGNNNYMEFSYDNWNDLVQVQNIVTSNEDGWFYMTNNYAYDAEGNLTNKVLTMFNSTNNYTKTLISSSYLYDANERLIGENDANGNPRWRYAYNPYSGKLAYATNMVSGIYCTYTYDTLGRIYSMVYNKSVRGWIPYYIFYTYDDSGRIIVKDAFGGGQSGIGAAQYTYDSLGNISYEYAPGIATNYYNYDLAGNRTSTYNVFGTTYFTPTNNNRLYAWGSNGSMTYDDAGCVTSLARNNKIDIDMLSWNGEYQLTDVLIDPYGDCREIIYTYDSLGRKISRKEFADNEWINNEYYIYDGMNLVADYDAISGRVIRSYTYGPGVDNIQSMTVYDQNNDSETYYYIKDASNTVHVLVDETGQIVEYYYYDAFGNLMKMRDENYQWMTESKCDNRFLFQGREYDYATQLYYFRNRWYEPETGRWLSPDPIGISGGLNLYAFCGNDPVNFVDPMGLDLWIVQDANSIWKHVWVVGDDENGGYWQTDLMPGWEKFPVICPANITTHKRSSFDPRTPNAFMKTNHLKVIKHIPTSKDIDKRTYEYANQCDENDSGCYICISNNCYDYAYRIIDYAKHLMDIRDKNNYEMYRYFHP